MLEVGLRVVRGHDWKWKDQDGGEGHAGTVVEIGKPPLQPVNGSSVANGTDKTPDKTVIVQWDHGSRSNYRIGYQGYYDLLVFDNAAAGVQHNNIVCDGCKKHGIVGIRWKCEQCHDYDLCTLCYMGDMHDLSHTFQRFQTSNSVGVHLTPREGCTKIKLQGIFIGAKVVRGPDWEWGNQDGGPGKTGRVIDIRGWDNESSRSVATVTWTSGNTNVYRLGYKGCVDLCYVEKASYGYYYKEHLPVLGQNVMTINDGDNSTDQAAVVVSSTTNKSSPSHLTFNVGDKVKVLHDAETLKEMQTGHGGWNPRMADYIGKIGTVHRITDKGDIRVQYEGCNNRWTFHPRALTKVINKDVFALGDTVRVKNDAAAVKNYQQGHGEWIDVMKSALGKLGKVIKIYSDGDLRVTLDGHTWTFNPLSVIKVSSTSEPGSSGHGEGHHKSPPGVPPTPADDAAIEIEKLLRDAARGEAGLSAVREFLRKYSGSVDARPAGLCGGKKTFLQVAAHQGNRELCTLLLDAGASLRAIDEDGDPPLHYAAFGNQAGVMELLLNKGASIDAINNSGCTALHVSVNKENPACVQVLLRHGCNVNLQDSYGDTALHDAISKDATEIIDALINCETVDFTVRNKRGFNVLHHAALKGNSYATKKLMTRIQHLVDVKKDDGFAALHLAALNGHRDVVEILLSKTGGRAKVDIQNNRNQSPLHLAVSQGHWTVVELLLKHSANVLAVDEDGDTVLHIAIAKSRHHSTAEPTPEIIRDAPIIYMIWQDLVDLNGPTELSLACFFISLDHGPNFIAKRNYKQKLAFDLLTAEQLEKWQDLKQFLESYVYFRFKMKKNNLVAITSEASNKDIKNDCQKTKGNSSSEKENSIKEELNSQTDKVPKKDETEKKERETNKDLERLKYLETRIADLEEANLCSICMERRRNVAFLCGHGACEHCSAPLKICHICRTTITKKIKLY